MGRLVRGCRGPVPVSASREGGGVRREKKFGSGRLRPAVKKRGDGTWRVVRPSSDARAPREGLKHISTCSRARGPCGRARRFARRRVSRNTGDIRNRPSPRKSGDAIRQICASSPGARICGRNGRGGGARHATARVIFLQVYLRTFRFAARTPIDSACALEYKPEPSFVVQS